MLDFACLFLNLKEYNKCMVIESWNQIRMDTPMGPETEAERIHRLGKEDHFRDIRKRYNVPDKCNVSYGYKTSMHKQILVDGEPLEAWYKNFLKNQKVN